MGTGNGSKTKVVKSLPKLKAGDTKMRNGSVINSKGVEIHPAGTFSDSSKLAKSNNTATTNGSGNSSTKKDKKEPGWWKKKDASGKTGQDKVVAGLEGASEVIGDMANAHAEANSGLTGGTGAVGKGAAVSSSGVVRDQDYQGYTEKKKKYGLT